MTGDVVKITVMIGEVVTGYCSDWRSSDRCYNDWRRCDRVL